MTLREAIVTSAALLLVGGKALCQGSPIPPPGVPAPPVEITISEQAPVVQPIQATPPVPPTPPLPLPATKAKKVSEMGLEELLQSALHNHAEIVQAQAKLREAEMDLVRIRQKILVQIAVRRAEFEAAKATYNDAKIRKDNAERLFKEKVISSEEAKLSDLAMLKAKAEMSRVEASLAAAAAMAPPGVEDAMLIKLWAVDALPRVGYVYSAMQPTGVPPGTPPPVAGTAYVPLPGVPTAVPVTAPSGIAISPDGKVLAVGTATPSVPAGTQKLLKKLTTPVTLNLETPTLADVIEVLGQHVDIVPPTSKERLNAKAGSANFKNAIPLGAAMQWVEDSFNVKLIVRDYGIVVTDAERVPPGALTVMDVWRQSDLSLQGGSPRNVLFPVPSVAPLPPKK